MTTPFPFVSGAVLTAAQLNDITNLPINDQTASYTLVVGDAGKRVVMNVASSNTVTVNNSVFTTGDTIFIANKGAGTSTITAGAGVTINTADSLAVAQYQSGTLVALSASSFLFFPTTETVTSGVVQVKSTAKTDTFTMSSTTFADVTSLSVSITPTSASNKILVIAACSGVGNDSDGTQINMRLLRDSTAIGIGDTAGSRTRATDNRGGFSSQGTIAGTFLDSPATTSATTYKVQVRSNSGTAVYINRSPSDTDAASFARTISTITVMEVTP